MSFPLFRREAGALVPANDEAKEALASVPLGGLVTCEVKRPRQLKELRLYWALCGTIADAIGANRENVSDVIKLRTGHFTVVQTKTERIRLPRSISFAKMDQAKFREFLNEACLVVCEEFIPHTQPGELRKQVEQMCGIPQTEVAA